MEKKKRGRAALVILMIFILSILSACSHQNAETEHPYQVVTAVHILYRNDFQEAEVLLSEEEAINTILEYLRSVSPYGAPTEAPSQVTGSHYYITLIRSDGSQSTYHQLADRMMQLNGGPWRRIDSELAKKLDQLLAEMPLNNSDPGTLPPPPLLRPELKG